jgi:cell division cycle 20-like protein 1 (cofactor of APC complex)
MKKKLANFKNTNRKINKLPIKVLDAPALQDDFYLNLLDWSNQNYLAVGLATTVYLWNAANSKVTKLCDLGIHNIATSVSCSNQSSHLSLGTNNG